MLSLTYDVRPSLACLVRLVEAYCLEHDSGLSGAHATRIA